MALREVSIDSGESTPLLDSLTDSYVKVEINQVKEPDDGKVPMFLLFGPKLKFKRIVSIYYIMFIFILFRISYKNAGVLILKNLKLFYSNSSSSFDESHPYSDYGLSSIPYAIPGIISIIFAILSDYSKYQRSYLLIYSFGLASFSAFLVAICEYILTEDISSRQVLAENIGSLNLAMLQVISVLAVISYVLGYAIFIPMPLTFGLDLLQGTEWKVLYLYFPFVYFLNNIGTFFSYLVYTDFPSRINSLVTLAISVFAWILFIIGRNLNLFPYFTPKVKLDLTISKGARIFYSAFKKRLETKSPRGHWFIQLASDMFYGDYPHRQVQMVSAFFKVNFTLMILFAIYTAYPVIDTLFPHQFKFLNWPTQLIVNLNGTRNNSSYGYLSRFTFINSFGVITTIPLFEFFFCNLIFYTDPNATPKCFRYITSTYIKSAYINVRKSIRNYFHPIDTIPKKIFWGLFLGLASVICGLAVDAARNLANMENTDKITCADMFNGICGNYTVSVFSQIPQYYLSGAFEALVIVGCQQFVYFQCYTAFRDVSKGLFLGLFYFYFCLGIIISNVTFFALDELGTYKNTCLIYTDRCETGIEQFTWIVWLIFVIAYLIIIVLFGIYSHYNHYLIVFRGGEIIENIIAIEREDG